MRKNNFGQQSGNIIILLFIAIIVYIFYSKSTSNFKQGVVTKQVQIYNSYGTKPIYVYPYVTNGETDGPYTLERGNNDIFSVPINGGVLIKTDFINWSYSLFVKASEIKYGSLYIRTNPKLALLK